MKTKHQLKGFLQSGILFFICLFVYMVGTAHRTPQIKRGSDTIVMLLPDSIIAFAKGWSGTRYKYGGLDESGFDCSGFTRFVFSKYNIQLPRSSREQYQTGVKVPSDSIVKADLLFFKGRNSKSQNIGHVGIAVSEWSNGNVYFVHSAVRGGIRMDSLTNPYYKIRYVGAARILNNHANDIKPAKKLKPF